MDFQIGATAWTKNDFLGRGHIKVTIRKARMGQVCELKGDSCEGVEKIYPGDLYGRDSEAYLNFCLDCLTAEEPTK